MSEQRSYALLVSDIDGTLVGEDKVVPPGVVGAVKAAQARGVRICLATGRMWDAARSYVDTLGADPPVILFNGGLVYDFISGRTLWARRMSPESVRRILPVIRRFPVSAHLFVHGKVFAERRTPFVDLFALRDRLTVEITPQFEVVLTEEPMKILVVGNPSDLDELRRALAALPGPPINQVSSQADYLEILPAGISKGVALPVLAQAAGVSLEQIVAVGDNLNDVTLLEAAGLGVAVEGSPQELLAVAGWVCPPPEREGVREVIERMFLAPTDLRAGREGQGGRRRP